MAQSRLHSILALPVLVALLSVASTPGAYGRGGSAKSELRDAVERTLESPALQVELRVRSRRPVQLQDYEAPDRLRVRAAVSEGRSIPSSLPIENIAVGTTLWSRDTLAEPPADELFVQCELEKPAEPVIFPLLGLAESAGEVHRVGDHPSRFEFVFEVEGDKQLEKLYDGLPGSATIRRGRVTRFDLLLPKQFGNERQSVWRLRYDGVEPIEAPRPDQIASTDCKYTAALQDGVPIEPID